MFKKILISFILLGCSNSNNLNKACENSFQCLHRWDTCYGYCTQSVTAQDGTRICLEYNRPLEKKCSMCNAMLGVSEGQAAYYDAQQNCNDGNIARQLSRHNGGLLPCDYKGY